MNFARGDSCFLVWMFRLEVDELFVECLGDGGVIMVGFVVLECDGCVLECLNVVLFVVDGLDYFP